MSRLHLEIKIREDGDYVRIGTLPNDVQERLRKHPELDRTKIKSLHTCCYSYHEYVEKNHFFYLIPDH